MPRDDGDLPKDTAPKDRPSIEARLDAVELLLREMLGFRSPIERLNIVTRTGAMVAVWEAEAVLSGDEQGRRHAAEVRAGLERLTE